MCDQTFNLALTLGRQWLLGVRSSLATSTWSLHHPETTWSLNVTSSFFHFSMCFHCMFAIRYSFYICIFNSLWFVNTVDLMWYAAYSRWLMGDSIGTNVFLGGGVVEKILISMQMILFLLSQSFWMLWIKNESSWRFDEIMLQVCKWFYFRSRWLILYFKYM